jgi:hypothetical protein
MPPPPMPPGIAGAAAFGFSAIMASVVISSDATETASVKATRTTVHIQSGHEPFKMARMPQGASAHLDR